MSKLDTVQSLIAKAGREDTQIDDARASALLAARMMVRYGFVIVDPTAQEHERTIETVFPDTDTQFEEVTLFTMETALHNLKCKKCGKWITKGSRFARGLDMPLYSSTCVECVSYFEGGK